MKLNNRQVTLAAQIREIVEKKPHVGKVSLDDPELTTWDHFIDCTAYLAAMLDGISELCPPPVMQHIFGRAWDSYAKFWSGEQQRLILDALGGDEALLERVQQHERAPVIFKRILNRIKGQKDGTRIDITDILVEEMDGDFYSPN